MESEKERILKLLERSFTQGAWYGPSVKEVLREITPEMAKHKLLASHSIEVLVAHMSAWRTYVTKKLWDMEHTVTDEMNFPQPTEWLVVLDLLDESQRLLLSAVRDFDEQKLTSLVPQASYPYTFYTLLHGIIHHDIYHVGQIVLLKKDFQIK
jgi:uncharacterized damage-inducible protein DinB